MVAREKVRSVGTNGGGAGTSSPAPPSPARANPCADAARARVRHSTHARCKRSRKQVEVSGAISKKQEYGGVRVHPCDCVAQSDGHSPRRRRSRHTKDHTSRFQSLPFALLPLSRAGSCSLTRTQRHEGRPGVPNARQVRPEQRIRSSGTAHLPATTPPGSTWQRAACLRRRCNWRGRAATPSPRVCRALAQVKIPAARRAWREGALTRLARCND